MLVSKNRFIKVVVKLPALNLDIKNFKRFKKLLLIKFLI